MLSALVLAPLRVADPVQRGDDLAHEAGVLLEDAADGRGVDVGEGLEPAQPLEVDQVVEHEGDVTQRGTVVGHPQTLDRHGRIRGTAGPPSSGSGVRGCDHDRARGAGSRADPAHGRRREPVQPPVGRRPACGPRRGRGGRRSGGAGHHGRGQVLFERARPRLAHGRRRRRRRLHRRRAPSARARARASRAITVAAVNGHAFAAGAMLATAHDHVVMREDRGYWCLPEVDLGLPLTAAMYAVVAAHLPAPDAARRGAHRPPLLRTRGGRGRNRRRRSRPRARWSTGPCPSPPPWPTRTVRSSPPTSASCTRDALTLCGA